MSKNYLRNHWLWNTVKVASLFVQLSATWHVFTEEFVDRSTLEKYFITICVAFLIDVLFISASYFIESHEIRTLDKVPFVVINILLAVFIVGIGITDESSILAVAPRIGIMGIVLADVIYFISEILENYFSREKIEQRIRDKQVIMRRRQDKEAFAEARKLLKKERIQLMIERERKTLGITEPATKEGDEVEPGIILLSEGKFAWADKEGNYHDESVLGKPYSLQGARLAKKRANGHLQQKVQRTR